MTSRLRSPIKNAFCRSIPSQLVKSMMQLSSDGNETQNLIAFHPQKELIEMVEEDEAWWPFMPAFIGHPTVPAFPQERSCHRHHKSLVTFLGKDQVLASLAPSLASLAVSSVRPATGAVRVQGRGEQQCPCQAAGSMASVCWQCGNERSCRKTSVCQHCPQPEFLLGICSDIPHRFSCPPVTAGQGAGAVPCCWPCLLLPPKWKGGSVGRWIHLQM